MGSQVMIRNDEKGHLNLAIPDKNFQGCVQTSWVETVNYGSHVRKPGFIRSLRQETKTDRHHRLKQPSVITWNRYY
jgi:hypothetical protein